MPFGVFGSLKISVVTVCLNAVLTIEKTIQSVICQDYKDMEYIIIDGQSVDGTLEVIRKYKSINGVKIITEKDTGLYNAMNKGIDVCSGDYVVFLNSGDVLIDSEVLSKIAGQIEEKTINGKTAGLVYGNVIKIYECGSRMEKYPGRYTVFKLLMMGKMPCHQAIFTKLDVLRKYRFDESYKICADFDFLLRCLHDRIRMEYIDVDVSKVDCVMGISSQKANLDRMRAEDDRSIKRYYPVCYLLMWPVKRVVRRIAR